MKRKLSLLIPLILLFLGACTSSTPLPTALPTSTATITPTLRTPDLLTTSVPEPQTVARSYLEAWKAEDYQTMYALLTTISQEGITLEAFTNRYLSVSIEAALDTWDYIILASLVNDPRNAQVSYRVILTSALVGEIQRDTVMNLSLQAGQWRVQWDDALILPELKGGNLLRMEYLTPARANLYDRDGHALVATTDAVAVGLDAANVDPSYQGKLLALFQEMTGGRVRADLLSDQLNAYRLNNWYLAVADFSLEQIGPYWDRLSQYSGVQFSEFRARYYVDEGIAPHVTGYVRAIQEGEIETYKRMGYNPYSDRIGETGLEEWGEAYLGGGRGGRLYLVSPDGAIITTLAERATMPSQAVYTTLNRDFQAGVRKALGNYLGAVVVLERDTGRVLAMASSPGYNPNLFEPTNANSGWLLGDVFDPQTTPLLNRATQGQYPLGSVFKIITMAAGLESGLYTANSQYNCGYFFDELGPDTQLHDWTYDHYLEDGKTQPSGILTLPQGLMRSCNPWFWHIGLDLFNKGLTTQVSNMARGFGLGTETGIEIFEESGNIPDPASNVDATNLAIGQGMSLVTPLQVADFIAAVGNGGALYTPKVVEKIVPPNGIPSYEFSPTLRGTLPISPTNLQIIQEAMVSVVTEPRGTAWHRFRGLNIAIAGKTGTAQSGSGEPHAWFAGYTFEGNPDLPDIAIVVIVENIGEGSDYAAPIFRRVVEQYFFGKALTIFPWESQIGVVKTATPSVTDTPVPTDTPAPTDTPQP